MDGPSAGRMRDLDGAATGNGGVILKLGDGSTSDLIVLVSSRDGSRDSSFYAHASVVARSRYLGKQLGSLVPSRSIRLWCCDEEYDYYVIFLRLLYAMQLDSPSFSLVSQQYCNVKSAIGVAKVAMELECDAIVQKCLQIVETAPWNDSEEEEIVAEVSGGLRSIDDAIVARLRPVDAAVVREVFLSAIVAATRESEYDHASSVLGKIKASAQEQIEYMLVEDDDAPLVTSDSQIKFAFRESFRQLFHRLKCTISCLAAVPSYVGDRRLHAFVLQQVADVTWASRVVSRLDLVDELVSAWWSMPSEMVCYFHGPSLSIEVKVRVMEIIAKIFEAVGYGSVLVAPAERFSLVRAWLPFVRDVKMALPEAEPDAAEETEAFYSGVESAINALVLSLPSDEQGYILADWLKNDKSGYPDLSEAFEMWCFRSKSAKRRLKCD